ncbi:hypothetical protein B0G38_003585 [Arthrobacter sp. VKM Ac-2550]|nr:hypothetical protein [Arthrobacter sp. VKM Ac-2550]
MAPFTRMLPANGDRNASQAGQDHCQCEFTCGRFMHAGCIAETKPVRRVVSHAVVSIVWLCTYETADPDSLLAGPACPFPLTLHASAQTYIRDHVADSIRCLTLTFGHSLVGKATA